MVIYFGNPKRVDLDMDGEEDIILNSEKQTLTTFKISVKYLNVPLTTQPEPIEEITGDVTVTPEETNIPQENNNYQIYIYIAAILLIIIGIVLVILKKKKLR